MELTTCPCTRHCPNRQGATKTAKGCKSYCEKYIEYEKIHAEELKLKEIEYKNRTEYGSYKYSQGYKIAKAMKNMKGK